MSVEVQLLTSMAQDWTMYLQCIRQDQQNLMEAKATVWNVAGYTWPKAVETEIQPTNCSITVGNTYWYFILVSRFTTQASHHKHMHSFLVQSFLLRIKINTMQEAHMQGPCTSIYKQK